jgi:hypothetical protein
VAEQAATWNDSIADAGTAAAGIADTEGEWCGLKWTEKHHTLEGKRRRALIWCTNKCKTRRKHSRDQV